MKRHVVLIGLPGSGKTTAGRLAARELGAPFTDIDNLVTIQAGKSIADIFAEEGEAAFRALEREAMARALRGAPAVLAPGGGWAAQPGVPDDVGNRALLIYLETAARVAVQRVAVQGGRPLLAGDPVERMEALLAERRAAYERAEVTLSTDGLSADQVGHAVARLARSRGGW